MNYDLGEAMMQKIQAAALSVSRLASYAVSECGSHLSIGISFIQC